MLLFAIRLYDEKCFVMPLRQPETALKSSLVQSRWAGSRRPIAQWDAGDADVAVQTSPGARFRAILPQGWPGR
jgi:hypothetical protein